MDGALSPFVEDAYADAGERAEAPKITVGKNGFKTLVYPNGTIEYEEPGADYEETEVLVPSTADHFDNLAEYLTESELRGIADELVPLIEQDKKSRASWEQRLARGITLMGVADDGEKAQFARQSKVLHPVLAEAVVQFSSRAIAELFPAMGPVKGVINGAETAELMAQRERVQGHMNFQYTVRMEEAFDEHDRMLFRLALEGSAFKKVYKDPLLGREVSLFVPANDVWVSMNARNLRSAPRVTHLQRYSDNEINKLMISGYFRQFDLDNSSSALNDEDEVEIRISDGEGREKSGAVDENDDDADHHVFYTECYYDLPQFKQPNGLKVPYIVAIHRQTEEVLAIWRNYKKNDPEFRKLETMVHYKYLPGLGFYGYGLLHMIGSLTLAATGALRSLLDSAQFSNMQGGFRTKSAKVSAGDLVIGPGEWKEVEGNFDDLQKAFFRIPYEEPSNVMMQLMNALTELARRFASTTEHMVGEAANTGPVGTTLALIEQGSKVFSSIHRRCHRAMGHELRLLHRLNADILPEAFEYAVGKDPVLRSDYTVSEIDIIPVSDPNVFSDAQRIAQSQAILELAKVAPPGTYDVFEMHRDMMRSMRVDNDRIERIIPNPEKMYFRMGPLDESMAFLMGKPVRAYAEQEHAAHITAHQQWLHTLPPDLQQMVGPAVMAHIGEHFAWQIRMDVQTMTGIELPPPPDFTRRRVDQSQWTPLPPALENKIAMLTAMALEQMPKPQAAPQKDPEVIRAEGKVKIAEMIAQAAEIRKDVAFRKEQIRKDKEAAADIIRENIKAQADAQMEDTRTAADIVRERAKSDASERRGNSEGSGASG